MIPILQMKQKIHKDARYLAQSYSVTKKQTKDLNPEVWLQSPCTWPHSLVRGKQDTNVVVIAIVTDQKEGKELALLRSLGLVLDI